MFKKLRQAGKGAGIVHKKATENMATVIMPPPARIVLLMQQHVGAPCEPLVKKGDTVKVGQVVGKAGGYVSADIHSGVSGTVVAIDQVVSATGAFTDAVVIETDGLQEIHDSIAPPVVRDRESFIEAVRASGLVGLGGAGFPTSVKMQPKNPEKIDTLIINAAECEPFITSDNREMLECGDTILSGIMAVKKYLDIPKAIIAVERNKPEAMDLMFSLAKGDPTLSVTPLATRYPQGAEKVMIDAVTGREVPNGGLPADVGVLMLNVSTVSAIGKYLTTGLPLMRKRITVDGSSISQPQNVEVIIGTPISDVIDFCGGLKTPPAKVMVGGPMMGVAMGSMSYPITKQNNALLLFSHQEAALSEPGPCIRCGRCISACPLSLSPVEICDAYETRNMEQLARLNPELCFSCGVCSYVCPAKRLVSQNTTLARGYYLGEKAKEKAKELAKEAKD